MSFRLVCALDHFPPDGARSDIASVSNRTADTAPNADAHPDAIADAISNFLPNPEPKSPWPYPSPDIYPTLTPTLNPTPNRDQPNASTSRWPL